MNTYSWGEFYETTISCDGYTEEIQKKFAIFEALDNATTMEEIKEIIDPLTENEINWLNSPCLDGIILGVKGRINPIISIISAKKDNVEACKYFLQKKIGRYNLLLACEAGLIKIVTLLLKNGVNANYYDAELGSYPLTAAAIKGHAEIVKILLENGADIHVGSEAALRRASFHGQLEVVKLLLERGANLYPIDFISYVSQGEVLSNACIAGHVEVVKFLLAYGVKVEAGDNIALRYSYKYLEIVKLLVEKGADIHVRSEDLLRSAITYGNYELVQFLIERGANIHIDDDVPVRSASCYGFTKIVQLLLENGANIHAGGENSLYHASSQGHVDTVKLLLKYGAIVEPNILQIAIENHRPEVVRVLLETGFRMENFPQKIQKQIDTVKVLLEFMERREKN